MKEQRLTGEHFGGITKEQDKRKRRRELEPEKLEKTTTIIDDVHKYVSP
jgi:hypothetical protein